MERKEAAGSTRTTHLQSDVSIPLMAPSSEDNVLTLAVPEENESWLNRSLIGVLRRTEDMGEIQELVREDLGWSCVARYMGRDLIWLEFDSEEELQKAKEDDSRNSVFSTVTTWSETLAEGGRAVWILCTGIPIQTWGQETFCRVGNRVGKLVAVDEPTSARKRLDFARMLIITENQEVINTDITVKVGEKLFKVHCREEPAAQGVICLEEPAAHGVIPNLDWMEIKSAVREEEEGGSASKSTATPKATPPPSWKTGSTSSTGPVTEEEIRAFLLQNGPVSAQDLVSPFKSRLGNPEDKKVFGEIVKRIGTFQKGTRHIVLRK